MFFQGPFEIPSPLGICSWSSLLVEELFIPPGQHQSLHCLVHYLHACLSHWTVCSSSTMTLSPLSWNSQHHNSARLVVNFQ